MEGRRGHSCPRNSCVAWFGSSKVAATFLRGFLLVLVLVLGGGFSFLNSSTDEYNGASKFNLLPKPRTPCLAGDDNCLAAQQAGHLRGWWQQIYDAQQPVPAKPQHSGLHPTDIPWVPQNAGVYNWTSVPVSLAPVLHELFSTDGAAHPAPIVASVRDKPAGAADRVRGLFFLAQLALVCGRKLRVEPDYLRSSEGAARSVETLWGAGRYVQAVDCKPGRTCPWSVLVPWALENPGHALVVNTNNLQVLVDPDGHHELGQHFNSSAPGALLARRLVSVCSASVSIRISCGAMLLHAAWGSSPHSGGQVSSLMRASLMQGVWADRFPVSGYSMLHMRAASAPLTVHGENASVSVPSVPFFDGHARGADRVDVVLSEVRRRVGTGPQSCSTPLAVASDSPRFVGELTFAVGSAVHIATCCGGGWHVARLEHASEAEKQAAENQVFFDLISLARARKVFCVIGGFGRLGRVFLSFGTAWSDFGCCTKSACLPSMVEQMWDSLQCVASEG